MATKTDTKKDKSGDDKSTSIDIVKSPDKNKTDISIRNEGSLFTQFEKFLNEMRRDFFDSWLDFRPHTFLSRELDDEFRTPLTNIEQNKKEYIVKAELPGIDKEQISVYLKENQIEISAESQKETTEDEGKNFVRREFRSTNFYRSFSIPNDVDQNKISIKFEKGILKIKLPKSEGKEKSGTKLEIN